LSDFDFEMNGPLRIRTMRPSDLTFADSLRALAGWNQTLDDWRFFLAARPQGCFLAEWDGAAAGTAATVVHGSELAWISMLLVHPEYRRLGIGRRLLLACLEHLQASGMRCIKLDATPEGRPLYQSLGFQDEWTLHRWEGGFSPNVPPPEIRAWREADALSFDFRDTRAFGASRRDLIVALARRSCRALTCESHEGQPAGWGLLRQGSRAFYLGPVSAISPAAGIALLEALLAYESGAPVFWDIPDLNTAARDCAQRCGFAEQRILTRMWLGQENRPGNPAQQFALAGPELG
jgi:ribosomal protein S18 acetylase RimI-like enzyme